MNNIKVCKNCRKQVLLSIKYLAKLIAKELRREEEENQHYWDLVKRTRLGDDTALAFRIKNAKYKINPVCNCENCKKVEVK